LKGYAQAVCHQISVSKSLYQPVFFHTIVKNYQALFDKKVALHDSKVAPDDPKEAPHDPIEAPHFRKVPFN
jgi:hypothetical protein